MLRGQVASVLRNCYEALIGLSNVNLSVFINFLVPSVIFIL